MEEAFEEGDSWCVMKKGVKQPILPLKEGQMTVFLLKQVKMGVKTP